MKPQLKKVALAVLFALGTVNASTALAACPLDGAKPFKAGPVNSDNGFATWVQDSQGVALELCLSGDGAGAPCFFDPVVPSNTYSVQVGFGAEAFWWLAEATLNIGALQTVVVMAAEAAWVAEVPGPGENFPFTRLRVVMDVPSAGIYTLVHPFGKQTWTVDQATFDATLGKRAIVEPIDIAFTPDQMNQGRVGPWLKSQGWPFTFPLTPYADKQFIGDGTPRLAEGSPCGTNYLRLTATALDGITPIVLSPNNEDGDGDPLTAFNDQITVHGQMFAGLVQTPLSVDGASYSRATDGSGRVNLFATAPTTALVTANVGGNISNMTGDGSGRYFTSVPFLAGPVPAASVTADNNPPLTNNADTTLNATAKALVTITRAEATCTGLAPRTCSLIIEASSSDRSANPALTTEFGPLVNGALTVSGLTVVPATVKVQSAPDAFDVEPVRVINQ